jgi:hypothetical protein
MSRLEKSDWLPNRFAQVICLSDVLTEPVENLSALSIQERNGFRNTQARQAEVVRVLGHHKNYSLIMMIDGAKGWIPRTLLTENPELHDFVRPKSPRLKPLEFLEQFKGVPYLWGGVSKEGIDCSGLVQLYFFSVHDKLIPRNSREQRRLAPEGVLADARDHSLVFGIGKKSQRHHVGLFLNSMIWHSYREEGVSCHTQDRFCELVNVEAMISILPKAVHKILIDTAAQTACLLDSDERAIKTCVISSSKYGIGYEPGSYKTPLGRFRIHRKIGENAASGTVFKSRVATGEMFSNHPDNPLSESPEDLILTRILWLEGLDSSNANTRERYIYLHGTNQEHLLGKPASHGCIRFGNEDILELFDSVDEGTEVIIT